jgi:hypothetical protein
MHIQEMWLGIGLLDRFCLAAASALLIEVASDIILRMPPLTMTKNEKIRYY